MCQDSFSQISHDRLSLAIEAYFGDELLRTSEIVIIALVMAFLAAGGALAFVVSPPSSPCAGVTGAARSITIIADLNGYNGSKYQTGSWPVATVRQCDNISITIVNHDTQAHGFAVSYYSNAGLEIVGGGAPQTLKFQAIKKGQFTMYCSLGVCTVHQFMRAGLLNVL
jgi:hypothetical protein